MSIQTIEPALYSLNHTRSRLGILGRFPTTPPRNRQAGKPVLVETLYQWRDPRKKETHFHHSLGNRLVIGHCQRVLRAFERNYSFTACFGDTLQLALFGITQVVTHCFCRTPL